MTQPATTIARGIAIEATDTTGNTAHLPTTWTYTTRDPYAITLQLASNDPRTTVTWLIGRDLLIHTLTTTPDGTLHGEGDINTFAWSDRLFINLSGPDGELLCRAPITPVRDFIAATCHLIAPGQETAHVDIDAGIAQLRGEVQS